MADMPTTATQAPGQDKPLLTKMDLELISRHVLAAVNPLLDALKAEINATRQHFQQQRLELTSLKGAVAAHENHIRIQADEIKRLIAKQDREDRKDKERTLIVQGLEKENPTEHFIKTVKEKLNIELKDTEFSLQTKEFRKRPKKNENTRTQNTTSGDSAGNEKSPGIETKTVVTVTFSSIWKKREVYDTRTGLHGTNVFLSEDLSAAQRAIFFKCRELRRNKKIKSTWTQDLKIWIRDNNDKKKTKLRPRMTSTSLLSHNLNPFPLQTWIIEPFQKLPTPPHGPRLLGPYGPRILREAFMASAIRTLWETFPETDYA